MFSSDNDYDSHDKEKRKKMAMMMTILRQHWSQYWSNNPKTMATRRERYGSSCTILYKKNLEKTNIDNNDKDNDYDELKNINQQ